MGSWRKKITATELEVERANNKVDAMDLKMAFNEDAVKEFEIYHKDIIENPALAASPQYYEMTTEEKQLSWFKKLNYIWTQMPEARKRYFLMQPQLSFKWFYIHRGQFPLNLHCTMFTHSMMTFCNDE